MSRYRIRQQIRFVLILFSLWQYVEIFYEVLGGGTRLAMPKTLCAPDSSSLKLGSGATEGVLDKGVLGRPDYMHVPDCCL